MPSRPILIDSLVRCIEDNKKNLDVQSLDGHLASEILQLYE